MKKGEPVNYLVAALIFAATALLVAAVCCADARRSDERDRIAEYFSITVPDDAVLIVKEESTGFGDGGYLYVYELPEETTARIAADFSASGWSALPFPRELSQALKKALDAHSFGEQLKNRGFYTSKQGYYLFSDLKGKRIDFQRGGAATYTGALSRFADYTFCVFDIQSNLLLFFIDIH